MNEAGNRATVAGPAPSVLPGIARREPGPIFADLALRAVLARDSSDLAPGVVGVLCAGTMRVGYDRLFAPAWLVAGEDAASVKPEGSLVACIPRRPTGGPSRAGTITPAGVGNAFVPLVETDELAAASATIAAGRRMDAGPESDRVLVVLAGTGLVFLDNDTTLPFEAGDGVALPAGFSARVWARGPESVVLGILQSQGNATPARTLASEVLRLREALLEERARQALRK